MAFTPLPVFSPEYGAFVNMIDRSHESTQDYAQLKHLIETSSLNSGENRFSCISWLINLQTDLPFAY